MSSREDTSDKIFPLICDLPIRKQSFPRLLIRSIVFQVSSLLQLSRSRRESEQIRSSRQSILFRLSEHAVPKNAIRVDRHDLYEGEKTEEFKKQTVRQTKKGGRRPRRSLRIRSGLTFLYLCIYEIYARSPLYPARMIKNKHARFFAISHRRIRDVPNKKSPADACARMR